MTAGRPAASRPRRSGHDGQAGRRMNRLTHETGSEAHAKAPGNGPVNAGNLFLDHVGSGRVAYVDLSRTGAPRAVTYDVFDGACNAVARGLRAAGLGPGDRVAIVSRNRGEFLETLFGAMRAGCAAVPINIRLGAKSIRFAIADSGAKLVFADAANAAHGPETLATIGFDDGGGYAAFLDPGRFAAVAPERDTVAVQCYTAGSTGRPKGVALGHAGIVWVSRTAVAMRRLGTVACTLIAAPMYHKNALQAVKQSLTAGGRMIVLERFDAARYIGAIEDHRCTILTGVPTMLALVLEQRELLAATDLSSVTRIGFGSAPASDALYDRLEETFPGAEIENVYGITEGGPIVFGPHAHGLPRPRNSIGCVMPGAEIRLAGDDGPDRGVLHVKSPGVMLGYHNLPDETAARLRDGWLDTGDILRRDADGFHFVVGRTDDMFVTSGENVHPGEIESVLERHPDILQAVVVAVADEIKGALPHAFVVPRDGADIGEDAVKRFALDNAPVYAHPRRVHFIAALPLTGANKIDRRALAARAAEAVPRAGGRR